MGYGGCVGACACGRVVRFLNYGACPFIRYFEVNFHTFNEHGKSCMMAVHQLLYSMSLGPEECRAE